MRNMRKAKPFGDLHHQRRAPQNNGNKEASRSWPNLPKRLIKHISDNPNTLKTLNYGVATKSWNSANDNHRNSSDHRRARKKMRSHHVIVSGDPTPIRSLKCDVEFRREYWDYWYQRNRACSDQVEYRPLDHRFAGCSHGFFFMRSSSDPSQLCFFDPVEKQGLRSRTLPDREIPVACAAFLGRPVRYDFRNPSTKHGNRVLMVATGISSPAFIYFQPDELVSSSVDPKKISGDDNMSFTNLIGFGGKFYALSSQGTLAVIERVGEKDQFDITAFGRARVVPSVPFRGYKECLIESDGDILLVFLVSGGASSRGDVFDSVEVYRLRLKDLSWVKMESLGKRTLFLGNDCCVSVCAEEVGCRRNCVYFMERSDSDAWFEFDMEFGSISLPWTDREISSGGNPLEWDKPTASAENNWFNVIVGWY